MNIPFEFPGVDEYDRPFSDSKTLLILGNGFDLSLGLPTQYSDFFGYLQKKYPLQSILPHLKSSTIRDFSDIPNFWYVFMNELENNGDINWNAVEKNIKEVVTGISELYAKPFATTNLNITSRPVTSIRGMKGSNAKKAAAKIIPYYISYKNLESKKSVFDFLLDELRNFENLFSDYLVSIKDQISNVTQLPATRHLLISLLNMSKINEHVRILNFNYTPTAMAVGTPTNIHGNVNIPGLVQNKGFSHIIFGIDGTEIDYSDDSFSFSKTARLLETSSTISITKLLSKECNNINFFGHSLDEADYNYFLAIFDYLNIYSNDITLNFFYSAFYSKNGNYLPEYRKAIINLLEKYESSIPDVSKHGSNIVSKLLLEGRLKFKPVS
jgi:hypothetical protein